MPLILGANSVSGGYNVANSLRFNSGSTDFLQRTPVTAGSLTTWTYSFWTKRSVLATAEQYLSAGPRSAPNVEDQLYSISTDAINWYDGTANANVLRTTQLFRDVSAWYHLMFVWDTTNATAGNRARIYVNGAEVTAFSIDNNPSLNAVSKFNGTGQHRIGQTGTVSGENLNGYLAEVIFIDGQALDPTYFGETDFDSGIWKPKAYTGSFGTNGFYLQFKNSGSLGLDSSGNANNFTVNNLTSVDQSTDTCTNNFATLNPIAAQAGSGVSSAVNTFTEGNLKVADLSSDTAISNFGVSTGKWFWEVQVVTDQDGIAIGACNEGFNLNAELGYNSPSSQSNGKVFGYYGNGNKFITIGDGSQFTSYGSAIAVNDIIGVALDLVNNQVTFYKNGTSQGTFSITALGSGENYFPAIGNWSVGAVVANFNFGSPPFTISSGNADAEGFGNFEYAVPSGYFALCSKNLAEYA